MPPNLLVIEIQEDTKVLAEYSTAQVYGSYHYIFNGFDHCIRSGEAL